MAPPGDSIKGFLWQDVPFTEVQALRRSETDPLRGSGIQAMSKGRKVQIRNSMAEFQVFTTQAGEGGIEVRIEDETVWLTQKLIATLFDVDIRTISEHLKNIFASGELKEDSVLRNFRNTAADGKQ